MHVVEKLKRWPCSKIFQKLAQLPSPVRQQEEEADRRQNCQHHQRDLDPDLRIFARDGARVAVDDDLEISRAVVVGEQPSGLSVRGIDFGWQLMESPRMGYSETRYYDAIIKRQIRSGRATSRTEVVHQELELLDALTRGGGPPGSTFESPDDLKQLLRAGLNSGPAAPMTDERWEKICGRKRA